MNEHSASAVHLHVMPALYINYVQSIICSAASEVDAQRWPIATLAQSESWMRLAYSHDRKRVVYFWWTWKFSLSIITTSWLSFALMSIVARRACMFIETKVRERLSTLLRNHFIFMFEEVQRTHLHTFFLLSFSLFKFIQKTLETFLSLDSFSSSSSSLFTQVRIIIFWARLTRSKFIHVVHQKLCSWYKTFELSC